MTYTQEQIDYIKNNFSKMTEPEMCRGIKLSRYHIQKIKRMNHLASYSRNRLKLAKNAIPDGFFDYDKMYI